MSHHNSLAELTINRLALRNEFVVDNIFWIEKTMSNVLVLGFFAFELSQTNDWRFVEGYYL